MARGEHWKLPRGAHASSWLLCYPGERWSSHRRRRVNCATATSVLCAILAPTLMLMETNAFAPAFSSSVGRHAGTTTQNRVRFTSSSPVASARPRLSQRQHQQHDISLNLYNQNNVESTAGASRKGTALRLSSKVSEDIVTKQHQQQQSVTTTTTPTTPTTTTKITASASTEIAIQQNQEYSYQKAIIRTLGWVAAATAFGGTLWTVMGPEVGEQFFAGYLVEQSLSVDNLFVFLMLFEYFKVPLPYQDRVLGWGIAGAVVMRATMIGLGVVALRRFHAILLVFASILVYSSGQVFYEQFFEDEDDEEEDDPSNNSIVKFSRSLFQSVDHFDGDRFFTNVKGEGGVLRRAATPLFICMVAVEISDIVFAVDSIPAVFGVTDNPLVVFSSNIFAILGLRSLYTILSKAATDLKYLEPAVAVVLGFIGYKMIAEYFGYCIPTETALSVVGAVLGTGVLTSIWEQKLQEEDAELDS